MSAARTPNPAGLSFGDRLAGVFTRGRHLCVGIDPHPSVLADWGLTDDAAGLERLGLEVVEAAAGLAACVKPQVSLFERHGAAGYEVLERLLRAAREAGVLTIADAKRGDIGSTLDAYAAAWLEPGSPLEADAMTAVAYQGFDSLAGALDRAHRHGKGVFVLAATSNPEAREVQLARRPDGRTVAAAVVDDAGAVNEASSGAVGSVGVVLGATLDLQEFGIERRIAPGSSATPVLAPGFGHQGARIEDAKQLFGDLAAAMLANESRSLLRGGGTGLRNRIEARAAGIAEALGTSLSDDRVR